MRSRVVFAVVLAVLVVAGAALPALAQSIDPGAGSWRTWVLTSGKEMRLATPPDAAATAAELREVKSLAAQRDARTVDRIRYWDPASPSYRWNEILTDTGVANMITTAQGMRSFTMLNVALHDAMVAAWDSKYAHNRRRPAQIDTKLTTAVTTPASPSYPCEHSVAAGAAAAVLSHLFPKDAARFAEAAEDASRSRVAAGVVFPSDAKAGLELGRAVGARVIDAMKVDGAKWAGTIPEGPGLWKGKDPGGIEQIQWKRFVLSSPDQFRPAPPPAPDSEARATEVAEVKNFKRTPVTNAKASYWQFGQFGQAGLHYLMSSEIGRRLAESGVDKSAPRAARAYALVHVAHYDGYIASQDAKFHFWTARPNQFDPSIVTVVPNPNFPTYVSNAATVSMAPALVMGHLFPREAPRYLEWAKEFGESRVWAGIHFRSDVEAGWEIGRKVGALVIERARRDGAE